MNRLAAALMLLAAAPLADLAYAQTQRSGGEAQKFMQQYQQIAAEKTALQTQLVQMKKDLDTAKADLAAMKKERDAFKSHVGVAPAVVAQVTASKEAAERSLEQSKQRTNELVARFRDMAANLRDVEADRAKLRVDLQKRDAAYDQCALRNAELYQINGEILDRYEHVGLFTKVSSVEPFTRVTRTRIENLADEYRERAQQLRERKGPPQVPAPAPATSSSAPDAPGTPVTAQHP